MNGPVDSAAPLAGCAWIPGSRACTSRENAYASSGSTSATLIVCTYSLPASVPGSRVRSRRSGKCSCTSRITAPSRAGSGVGSYTPAMRNSRMLLPSADALSLITSPTASRSLSESRREMRTEGSVPAPSTEALRSTAAIRKSTIARSVTLRLYRRLNRRRCACRGDAPVHHAEPERRHERQQEHGAVSCRQTRCVRQQLERLVSLGNREMVVRVAGQVDQQPVAHTVCRIPRVLGAHALVLPRFGGL